MSIVSARVWQAIHDSSFPHSGRPLNIPLRKISSNRFVATNAAVSIYDTALQRHQACHGFQWTKSSGEKFEGLPNCYVYLHWRTPLRYQSRLHTTA